MPRSNHWLYAVLLCWLLTGHVRAQATAKSAPVFVRGFAPDAAVLRTGRQEMLVAVVKCIRRPSGQLSVRMSVPSNVKLLSSADVPLVKLEAGEITRVEWHVVASEPLRATAEIHILDADSKQIDSKRISIRFESPIDAKTESYVPIPKTQDSEHLILAHYCPLWKYGAHSMGWDTIEPWPERKPAIGFYDEGTPLVADWQINYALEHGIDGFIFTWDKAWLNPAITNSPGEGLTNGFLRSRFLNKSKFCINWADQYYTSTRQELLDQIFPFWLEHFFKHPSYVCIDNRPVLFVTHPEQVASWMGGIEESKNLFEELRNRCRKHGFDGLTIVGCVPTAEPDRLKTIARAGFDATSAYIFWADLWNEAKKDVEGIPTFSHAAALEVHGELLTQRQQHGVLPDIVTVQMGWDSRPWHGVDTPYYLEGTTVEAFEKACKKAKQIVQSNDQDQIDGQVVVIDNWNEFGEGHFIEPTAGYGFEFLDAVKNVFVDDPKPCTHIVPTDLVIDRPDHVFEQCRGIMHKPYRRAKVESKGLVAAWLFDREHEYIAEDSSGAGFHALKSAADPVSGVKGLAFQSKPFGYACLGADDAFYPQDGVTVQFWYKAYKPQENAFIVNTAAEENTGYGVAMRNGKLAFFVNWTQLVETPQVIPLGVWTHVAATCDNRKMTLYVDGESKVSADNGQQIRPAHKGTIAIGAYSPGATNFQGAIDELKIHRRALSANEIRIAASIGAGSQ